MFNNKFFYMIMILIAFITFNNSLLPWLRVYEVQIHGSLSARVLDGIEAAT